MVLLCPEPHVNNSAVAHAQVTDDTFAACLHPLRGALPKGGTGSGRNAPEDAPWLHSSAVGSEPSAAGPCCGAGAACPSLFQGVPGPRSLPLAGRGAAAVPHGGPGGGEGRGVARRQRRRRGERRAALAPLAALRSRPGNSAKAALPPLPRPAAPRRWRSLLEKAAHGTDGERGFNQLCRALRGAAGVRWAAG